ncbi:hypothetical protein J6590_013254 [Homalodisca vitripennis]|nr:hypothetical protein J6590_013254 [Homalodisca vitripennis]
MFNSKIDSPDLLASVHIKCSSHTCTRRVIALHPTCITPPCLGFIERSVTNEKTNLWSLVLCRLPEEVYQQCWQSQGENNQWYSGLGESGEYRTEEYKNNTAVSVIRFQFKMAAGEGARVALTHPGTGPSLLPRQMADTHIYLCLM